MHLKYLFRIKLLPQRQRQPVAQLAALPQPLRNRLGRRAGRLPRRNRLPQRRQYLLLPHGLRGPASCRPCPCPSCCCYRRHCCRFFRAGPFNQQHKLAAGPALAELSQRLS